MARTDTFDMKRFGRYLSFELKETVRENGLFILLMGLVPLMVFIVTVLFSLTYDHEKIDEVWSGYYYLKTLVAFIAVILFLLVFPILRYGRITDRREGQMPLMLPASHTEKFCSAFLLSVIAVPAVFMLLYFGTDSLLSAIFPKCGGSLLDYYSENDMISHDGRGISISLSCPVVFFLPPMVSLAGLSGGALFKKNKIAKTFFACTAALILFFLIMTSIVGSFGLDAGQTNEMADRNFTWFWYAVQTAVAAGLGFYYWKRTSTIEL